MDKATEAIKRLYKLPKIQGYSVLKLRLKSSSDSRACPHKSFLSASLHLMPNTNSIKY